MKKIAKDKYGNNIYQVEANGIKIGYKIVGSGYPLLIIMGLGGNFENWPEKVINKLSENYQLIILDNRGIGYTTSDDRVFSYQLFADDIVALLDKLNVKKADVLGYSMGSTITQKLLLEYPERVNKAVIYATSINGSDVAKKLNGKVPEDPIIRRQIEATVNWKTPLDKMALIKNQVMLLVGTDDKVVGVESSKKLATIIPGAWFVQFKKGSHLLIFEAPEKFVKVVLLFLDIDETVH